MDRGYLNMPLNPLRTFAIAARHNTFTAAAAYMGVSQVAVSRQVAILEKYLNVQLFERGTRTVRLTQLGRALSHEIGGLFDEIENATRQVLEKETDNTIRLRIYPTTAHYWLMPRLADFKSRYPEYRLRLDTNVEPLDFRGAHLDVAIQLGRGDWAESRCRKLMDITLDAVCSQSYLDAVGPLNSPQDLNPNDLLHSRYRRKEWAQWLQVNGIEGVDHRRGLEYESSLLTYTAIRSGLGVGIGQIENLGGYLGDEFASGRLVRPFNLPIRSQNSFYVVWPTLTSVSKKTRHFIDWVLEQVGQPPEFFPQRSRTVLHQPVF
jgi:LysR family glycine cleavage system transcriptional activator